MVESTEVELEQRQQLKDNFDYYARNCLVIKTKSQGNQPLILNKAQQYIHKCIEEQLQRTGKVRAILLKGRQQGGSTYVEGRFVWKVTHNKSKDAYILTHEDKATQNLFNMSKRYIDYLPDHIKPVQGKANANELTFVRLESGFRVGTAGNKSVGRSMTNQYFHGCLSEDSLIVLADGSSVSMLNVKIGDLVVTSSGAVAPVVNKIYTGEKETFTLDCWLSGEPIHLTQDHKVLTIDGYKELKNITTSDFIAMPNMAISGEIKTWRFDLKNKERFQGGGSRHIESFDFPLNYDFGYLVGYYLAEGHIKDNFGYVTFTFHKKENYIENAIKGSFGLSTSISYKADKGTNRKRANLYGKYLASALNELCGRVDGKHIPDWFFKTNKDFLSGVFKGYLDGDGSKTSTDKIVASSVHEKISRQIQRICWGLYGACSVRRKTRERYNKKTKDIFLFSMSGEALKRYRQENDEGRREKSIIKEGSVYSKVRSIKPRRTERVWDIEIGHKDHNYQTTSGVVSNSEVAFWPNAAEHAKGILQTVPDEDGTEIIYESTANGLNNFFHQQWKLAEAGMSEFIPIFVPWYWQDEYRKEFEGGLSKSEEETELARLYNLDDQQIFWRRMKITELSTGENNGNDGELSFKQEYPMNAAEAFQVTGVNGLITPTIVERARKNVIAAPSGALVVGVDPSRGGDRFSIVKRCGRKAYGIESYVGTEIDTLGKAVTKCINVLDTPCLVSGKKPDMMFVDAGGGSDLVDRLHELGYRNRVKAIFFGGSPLDEKKFTNRRNEMWGLMNLWLRDENLIPDIPDDDSLHADLCASPYELDVDNRKVLWNKKKIKEKFGFSPDEGDALALTFAEPVVLDRDDFTHHKVITASRGASRFDRSL